MSSRSRGRACPARMCIESGCLREGCGPDMSGPYRPAIFFYTYISWLRGGSLGTAGRGAAAVRQAAGERPTSRLKTRQR